MRLGELLDDDVWAFSNCRVDAPGRPVAEIDWFFYNVRHGTLMVSEWKGFPQRVVSATDTGARWQLEGGLMVANPIEQVSKQLDAVRLALRNGILPQHFPDFDPRQLLLMQSVYSPQVDERTEIERIRWGKVYGSLPDLAAVICSGSAKSIGRSLRFTWNSQIFCSPERAAILPTRNRNRKQSHQPRLPPSRRQRSPRRP